MSKYVISDVHGMYDKFLAMLELIHFSDKDELYILGDVMDRGPKPLEIIDYIINHKNIHLIKGNHESMFTEYFEEGSLSLWYMNGGNATHSQIVQRDYLYEESLYKYIKRLPYYMVVDNFILTHAGVFFPEKYNDMTVEEFLSWQDEETSLWSRSNIHSTKSFKDYKIICGHTPVQSINNNYDDVKIIHTPGHIYIDCGCCFTKANGKLACLCLDDMKEYYV